ncbi:histone-lysine N-methyltransferase SETMAR [Trichonephila clavipes]|nr:histone-lysine N-methyltransferase SETMAR [Trichonephila clavipes]
MNATRFCATLSKLRDAIRKKLLKSGVLLLDDNARPHAVKATQNQIGTLVRERLHHPPYSHDLSPSDLPLFPALEAMLKSSNPLNASSICKALRFCWRAFRSLSRDKDLRIVSGNSPGIIIGDSNCCAVRLGFKSQRRHGKK